MACSPAVAAVELLPGCAHPGCVSLPRCWSCSATLAAVLHRLKRWSDARAVYRRAVTTAPNSATVLSNFANFLVEQVRMARKAGSGDATDDLKLARELLAKGLRAEPNHVVASKN